MVTLWLEWLNQSRQLLRAGSGARWQLLAGTFLVLTSCTAPSPPDSDAWMPAGWYRLECDIINRNGLVRLTHVDSQFHVELPGEPGGSFSLQPGPRRTLSIVDAEMDYPGLKRSFKGSGKLIRPGEAAGTAVIWLKSMGPLSRNHREGSWSLRPATASEIRNHEARERQMQERKSRARQAGADFEGIF